MSERVVGYLFLCIGVIVIVFCAVNVYLVFTQQIPSISFIDNNTSLKFNMNIPGEGGELVKVPLELGEVTYVFKLINSIAHLMLMGFLASIGYKIALIGAN